MAAKFSVFMGENHGKLSTLGSLTKPYKTINNVLLLILVFFTTVTNELSVLLTS